MRGGAGGSMSWWALMSLVGSAGYLVGFCAVVCGDAWRMQDVREA